MLVQLALQKWAECGIKADNISVVVVIFDNCKSLRSCSCKYKHRVEEDRLAEGCCSTFSAPISVTKKLCKTRQHKKSQTRNPLTSINSTQKCCLKKHEKSKFKIPTTPEQRSAYWSHRKNSRMIENLPLDFDLFANENVAEIKCVGRVQVSSLAY